MTGRSFKSLGGISIKCFNYSQWLNVSLFFIFNPLKCDLSRGSIKCYLKSVINLMHLSFFIILKRKTSESCSNLEDLGRSKTQEHACFNIFKYLFSASLFSFTVRADICKTVSYFIQSLSSTKEEWFLTGNFNSLDGTILLPSALYKFLPRFISASFFF